MVCLYCEDLSLRAECHHYYRDLGILIEAVPSGEFVSKSFSPDTDALLIVGSYPPGLLARLSHRAPLYLVSSQNLSCAYSFDNYYSPKLVELLRRHSVKRETINHLGLMWLSSLGTVYYLGYRLRLTKTEFSILFYLVKNYGKDIPLDELLSVCIGDVHRKPSNIARHVANINKKARIIGERTIIISSKPKTYRLEEYI